MKSLLMVLPLLCVLFGCAQTKPYRTNLVESGSINCPFQQAANLERCAHITPESGEGYELHFVEFDDQGWAAALPGDHASFPKPSATQTDHLMTRLRTLLENGDNLNIILYVHGWQHSAKSDDHDVQRFRQVLASASTLQGQKLQNPRKTVGIYIGWRGSSWTLPGVSALSFWSRKETALRVSHGAAQELFARLRTLQHYYNSKSNQKDCRKPVDGMMTTGGCKVRTLMIGHSFGAWILYSAMSAQIIAALNSEKDLEAADEPGVGTSSSDTGARIQTSLRRPADMIVLINPAFEAVRYQPVHQAAIRQRNRIPQPPLLVTISTSGDVATRTFFPIGRFFDSIFQRPTTSDEQAKAMTRTHSNYGEYQTHQLSVLDQDACKGWIPPGALSSTDPVQMENNKRLEKQITEAFFKNQQKDPLKPWTRYFCGGLKLSLMEQSNPRHNRDPLSLVWNIWTNESVIPSHSKIIEWRFLEFVRQLYADTDLAK